ncbi:primosomal protein N' [Vandammella animalimorsus]|uniref:replication restart helicase PriA n=1 Tax=Vandammella animalimorsus TaxID=2029117 RepID=UPI00325A60FA
MTAGQSGAAVPEADVHSIQVAVDAPFHSGIGHLLSYRSANALPPGTLVRVPLGQREVLGIVWPEPVAQGQAQTPSTQVAPLPNGQALREVLEVLDGQPPLVPSWCHLIEFAARYYQRSLGEMALLALPAALQEQRAAQWHKRLAKLAARAPAPAAAPMPALPAPALTPQQQGALQALRQHGAGTSVLHGVTGSGKTEVYLQLAEQLLREQPQAQVLFMVPEINLVPQWQALLQARFGPWLGADCVAVMHSGLTPVQRLNHWLAVHHGHQRLVLGTRLAVLASFAQLALIVVDEEHDPSYKQQEGARYHARDLAVWRGRQLGVPVVLGSATPSLESWHNSRAASAGDAGGRYQRLSMPERIGGGALAALRVVDMREQPREAALAPPLLQAMRERLEAGEQCMVLLNRRGYAPVLRCGACGWKSDCPHCSAHQVLHKAERSLRCHHCGWACPAPRHCPRCGSIDLAPLGRGTEQLQELLQKELGELVLSDGRIPQVLRIDADSTRHKGALQQSLAQVHRGDVDVLVGTQMIAKGHDFRRIGLVAVVQPDGALYSSDFRAPERLFALLMQAAGRAGRDAQYMQAGASQPELWLQTHEPGHPLYAALARQDYPGFAAQQLRERQQAGMPPFVYQALLRADARTQDAAQAFLRHVAQQARAAGLPGQNWVTLYPPLPLSVQRVANTERAQMLLESASRKALQAYLAALQPLLHQARGQAPKGLLRWLVDVDPLAI